MKKTLRQWFEMFPEPYRTQAIENTIEQFGELKLERSIACAVRAVSFAFVWDDSPQKCKYWEGFRIKLYRGEIVLTEPRRRWAMSNEELYSKIRIHVETTEECLDNFNVPFYVRELMQQDLELFVLVMKHLEDKGGNNG